MLNLFQHLKKETLKRVQGDVGVVFRVTLPLSRHAELDSASQDETLKRVQGDATTISSC
jgi:hypothetical protein